MTRCGKENLLFTEEIHKWLHLIVNAVFLFSWDYGLNLSFKYYSSKIFESMVSVSTIGKHMVNYLLITCIIFMALILLENIRHSVVSIISRLL